MDATGASAPATAVPRHDHGARGLSCRTASASSPSTCPGSRRSRSGSGWRAARASSRASWAASRTSSSTCSSRAPSGARAAQIAEEIDAVGGVLNAFTGKEYTCYYAQVLAEHAAARHRPARRHLPQLALRPRTRSTASAASSCRRSRRARTRRTTTSTTSSPALLARASAQLPGVRHAPRRSRRLQRADFVDFLAARYRPDRLIIAAAGDIDPRDARSLGGARLRPPDAARRVGVDGTAPQPTPRRVHGRQKPLEQVHVCVGVPGRRAGRRGPLRRLPAQHGARRRHELAPLPGDPREARPRLLGLLLPVVLPRCRLPRRLRRHRSRSGSRTSIGVIASELQARGARRAARRRARAGEEPAQGQHAARPRDQRQPHEPRREERDLSSARLPARARWRRGSTPSTNDEIVALAARLVRPESMAVALLGDLDGHGSTNPSSAADAPCRPNAHRS